MQKNIHLVIIFLLLHSICLKSAYSIETDLLDEDDSSFEYGRKKQILQTSDPFLNKFYNIKKEKTEIAKEMTEEEKEILNLKYNGYDFTESDYIKAIENGDNINVMKFIYTGMPVNKLKTHDNSTLFYAIRTGQKETFTLLKSKGADVNFVNNRSQNLLLQAIELGFEDMIPFLTESGIDLRFVDHNGWSAMHYAIEQKNIRAVFILMNKSPVLLNYKNRFGNTPLLLALDKSYKKHDKELIVLAKILLKNEKYINVSNAVGNTALHFAAMLNDYDLTKYILELGANPNVNNVKGWKPIDIAVKNKNIQIANLLRYYGSKI